MYFIELPKVSYDSAFLKLIQLQLTFNLILVSGGQHLYNLGSDSPGKSSTHLAPNSYYSSIAYIRDAVLYIPVTVL